MKIHLRTFKSTDVPILFYFLNDKSYLSAPVRGTDQTTIIFGITRQGVVHAENFASPFVCRYRRANSRHEILKLRVSFIWFTVHVHVCSTARLLDFSIARLIN